MAFDGENRLISQRLGLTLVRWAGVYQGVEAIWLRWATLEGELLPITEEKAAQAEEKAAKMAAQLRAMGVDPDSL